MEMYSPEQYQQMIDLWDGAITADDAERLSADCTPSAVVLPERGWHLVFAMVTFSDEMLINERAEAAQGDVVALLQIALGNDPVLQISRKVVNDLTISLRDHSTPRLEHGQALVEDRDVTVEGHFHVFFNAALVLLRNRIEGHIQIDPTQEMQDVMAEMDAVWPPLKTQIARVLPSFGAGVN